MPQLSPLMWSIYPFIMMVVVMFMMFWVKGESEAKMSEYVLIMEAGDSIWVKGW